MKIVIKKVILVWLIPMFVYADFIRDDTKDVVVDRRTNLMWQDDANTKTTKYTWENAITYCENISHGDHDDWRLPNINELFYLADRSNYNPTLSSKFDNISNSYYWSSTTDASDTTKAWIVYFGNGGDNGNAKSDVEYVRCVRDN